MGEGTVVVGGMTVPVPMVVRLLNEAMRIMNDDQLLELRKIAEGASHV